MEQRLAEPEIHSVLAQQNAMEQTVEHLTPSLAQQAVTQEQYSPEKTALHPLVA